MNKEERLTPEEYAQVKSHVTIASRSCPLSHLGEVIPFVRHHHEQWDGHSYPDGSPWRGDPLGARILCAAEIYDASYHGAAVSGEDDPDDSGLPDGTAGRGCGPQWSWHSTQPN